MSLAPSLQVRCLWVISAVSLLLYLGCDLRESDSGSETASSRLDETFILLIDAPRPLAEAAIAVSEKLNAAVTYEDPPFVSDEDLRPIFHGSASMVPRNITLMVAVETNDTRQVIDAVLREHDQAGYGGDFIASNDGQIHNIRPNRYKNSKDEMVSVDSILDQAYTIDTPMGASYVNVFELLIEAMKNRNSGVSIIIASPPHPLLRRIKYPHPRFSGAARSLLNGLLNVVNTTVADDRLMTWQLRYAPSPDNNIKPLWVLQFLPVQVKPSESCKLRVESQRPLLSAVNLISRQWRQAITYEDPVYSCPCTLVGLPGANRVALSGGMVQLDWRWKQESLSQILDRLVARPVEPRDPGEMFQYNTGASAYHIFPKMGRTPEGSLEPATSPLGRDVHIHDRIRTTARIILSDLVAAVSSKEVKVALVPKSEQVAKALSGTLDWSQAAPVTAREVLSRVVSNLDGSYSWNLVYVPESESFQLEIFDLTFPED